MPIPSFAVLTHEGTLWSDVMSFQLVAVQIGLPAGQAGAGPAEDEDVDIATVEEAEVEDADDEPVVEVKDVEDEPVVAEEAGVETVDCEETEDDGDAVVELDVLVVPWDPPPSTDDFSVLPHPLAPKIISPMSRAHPWTPKS
jgi:hypothetical protein